MSKSEVINNVERMAEAIAKMSPGSVINHGVLAPQLQFANKCGRYYGAVSLLRRKLLRDHQVQLATEPNVGYKVLQPARMAGYLSHQAERGVKIIKKASSDAGYIPIEKLSQTELSATMATIQRISSLARFAANALKREPSARPALPAAAGGNRSVLEG